MTDKLIANPSIVFREEFDDWALLFDPETGDAFGMNPVGAFIWKRMDGKHTVEDILKELMDDCEDVPDNAREHISKFVSDLENRGFVGLES